MPTSELFLTEVNIPNFLVKLWRIVEDEAFQTCISWDDTGFSFHILDPLTLSKEVLPVYFKHNNLNSFVRQLNMYGFRKVTPLERSGLNRAESDQEHLEFQHPYFVRGHPELLQQIHRKTTSGAGGSAKTESGLVASGASEKGLQGLLDEVRQLRERQLGVDNKLGHMKKENETLWREVAHMRQMHHKQQQVVNKLIHFLLSVVQPTSGSKRLGKRQLLAIGPNGLEDAEAGPSTSKRFHSTDSATALSDAAALIQHQPTYANSNFDLPVNTNPQQTSLERQQHAQVLGNTLQSGPTIRDVTDDPIDQSAARRQLFALSPEGAGSQASPITGENVALNQLASRGPPTGSLQQQQQMLSSANYGNVTGTPAMPRPTSFGKDELLAAVNSGNGINLVTNGIPPSPGPLERNELEDYVGSVEGDLDLLKDFFGNDPVNLNFDPDALENLFALTENETTEQQQEGGDQPVWNTTEELGASNSNSQSKQVALYQQTPYEYIAKMKTPKQFEEQTGLPTNEPDLHTPIVSPTVESSQPQFTGKKGRKTGKK